MRTEQEVMAGDATPFTLDELWEFRKELKEVLGDKLDEKLAEFAQAVRNDPFYVPAENRDVAYKIFWMMSLIPAEPNQN